MLPAGSYVTIACSIKYSNMLYIKLNAFSLIRLNILPKSYILETPLLQCVRYVYVYK